MNLLKDPFLAHQFDDVPLIIQFYGTIILYNWLVFMIDIDQVTFTKK